MLHPIGEPVDPDGGRAIGSPLASAHATMPGACRQPTERSARAGTRGWRRCWLAIEPLLRRRLVLQTHAWIAERVLNAIRPRIRAGVHRPGAQRRADPSAPAPRRPGGSGRRGEPWIGWSGRFAAGPDPASGTPDGGLGPLVVLHSLQRADASSSAPAYRPGDRDVLGVEAETVVESGGTDAACWGTCESWSSKTSGRLQLHPGKA